MIIKIVFHKYLLQIKVKASVHFIFHNERSFVNINIIQKIKVIQIYLREFKLKQTDRQFKIIIIF